MAKVRFQFISGASPKYKSLGYGSYEPIEVEGQELDRIKGNGYNVEVLSKPKSEKKTFKKKEKE